MSFHYMKPLIPALHRCHNCGKRLSKHDKIIAYCLWGYSEVLYEWYCSKECAKSFEDKVRLEQKKNDELNVFIKGKEKK